jgi:hypothetical protein
VVSTHSVWHALRWLTNGDLQRDCCDTIVLLVILTRLGQGAGYSVGCGL